ncbi:hypothetical protein Enr13x_34900 [Stieleria neptunia]|uniref:Uncharacterized protein n=1 Tax=Stieleria neptunia TaxID=2527979 RepID=A0A518HS11_9BACT|nr:hypothetical protein Enr13x_34900 [Stieleria neptunia]
MPCLNRHVPGPSNEFESRHNRYRMNNPQRLTGAAEFVEIVGVAREGKLPTSRQKGPPSFRRPLFAGTTALPGRRPEGLPRRPGMDVVQRFTGTTALPGRRPEGSPDALERTSYRVSLVRWPFRAVVRRARPDDLERTSYRVSLVRRPFRAVVRRARPTTWNGRRTAFHWYDGPSGPSSGGLAPTTWKGRRTAFRVCFPCFQLEPSTTEPRRGWSCGAASGPHRAIERTRADAI